VKNILKGQSGSTTIEYAIVLPMVFACVIGCITIFLLLYQKAMLQSTAENLAESVARQWNYESLNYSEINHGVFEKSTFNKREVYWNLKFFKHKSKAEAFEQYCHKAIENKGLLKLYREEGRIKSPEVEVKYHAGFPSYVTVKIKATYYLPGASMLWLLGMGESITIQTEAQCHVHDSKDMINTADYVVQLVRETKVFAAFEEKLREIKRSIEIITDSQGS